VSSYERLEFLGDSVLALAIARSLYDNHPHFSEGRLAKVRAHVVSRASCAAVAEELQLGSRLGRFGMAPGDEVTRLRRNRNVLGALLEAAIAALFLEHGFAAIEHAIVAAFGDRVEYALTTHVDHKTELQELLARSGRQVSYAVTATEGPPHDRSFTVVATVDGRQVSTGRGRSKKDAEQAAAKEALVQLAE
jgi:ribonuclease III